MVLLAAGCRVRLFMESVLLHIHTDTHAGTPAQIARGTDEMNLMNLDDHRSRRKNTPGDQSMRRSIQDLVSSIDPNVKIDPEVEDVR